MLKRTKTFALLLAMTMSLTAAVGCGAKKTTETGQTGTSKTETGKTETAKTETTKIEVPKETAKPKEMTIARALHFGDSGEALDLKEEFPKVLEKEYGIKFNIVSPPRNNYMEKINLMVTSGELKGLVNLFTPDDLLNYRNDGSIEPLDAYLKDNKIWNSLPKEMKEMYQFYGETWGIPTGLTGNYFTRSIRKDWLDKLGLKVPQTVQELYDVSKAFTLNDPDGNGKNDTVGMTSSGTWNMQDIFQAFDARLNHVGGSSLAWDPNKNAWNDSMLNPGMVDALNYLAKAYKEGILDKETFTNNGTKMRENMFSGKFGSTSYWLMWGRSFEANTQKNVPTAVYVEIPALKGTITKNLNQVTFSNAPYVLIKGTPQAKEVVNSFVNIFLGEEKGHYMGVHGIPGKNYEIQGKNITNIGVDANNKAIPKANLVESMPGFDDNAYTTVPKGATPEQINVLKQNQTLKKSLLEDKIAEGLLYQMGNNRSVPLSAKYAEIRGDVERAFNEAVVKAVTGTMPVEQAIKEYREQCKKIGAQQILDEANKAINATGFNKY